MSKTKINVPNTVMNTIISKATNPFYQTGVRLPDGSWDVPVSDDVIQRVRKYALAGEKIWETIERILSKKH